MRNPSQELETQFCNNFGWTPNKKQKVGVAYDAEDPDTGERFEIKGDFYSLKSGVFYVEFRQKFEGSNWKPSGISLAKDQADWLVISDGQLVVFVKPKRLIIKARRFETKETRAKANGNRRGSYSEGYMVPFETVCSLAEACFYIRKPQNEPWQFQKIFDHT